MHPDEHPNTHFIVAYKNVYPSGCDLSKHVGAGEDMQGMFCPCKPEIKTEEKERASFAGMTIVYQLTTITHICNSL